MPSSVVKNLEDEKYWKEAKRVTREQYPDLESKDKNRFYAVVMSIYKNMCKNKGCAVKGVKTTKEPNESMSLILGRLELLESIRLDLPKTYKDWLLYDPADKDSADLTKKAVSELNLAVKTAASYLLKDMKNRKMNGVFVEKDEGEVLSKVWKKYVKPVLNNKSYESVGFGDPEPRVLAGQKLIDIIKEFYGVKGWTSLGDYI